MKVIFLFILLFINVFTFCDTIDSVFITHPENKYNDLFINYYKDYPVRFITYFGVSPDEEEKLGMPFIKDIEYIYKNNKLLQQNIYTTINEKLVKRIFFYTYENGKISSIKQVLDDKLGHNRFVSIEKLKYDKENIIENAVSYDEKKYEYYNYEYNNKNELISCINIFTRKDGTKSISENRMDFYLKKKDDKKSYDKNGLLSQIINHSSGAETEYQEIKIVYDNKNRLKLVFYFYYDSPDKKGISIYNHVDKFIYNDDTDKKCYLFTIVNNLRLREKPALDSKIIRNLKKDEKLEFIKYKPQEVRDDNAGVWVNVITQDGKTGWCFSDYLKSVL